MSKEKETKFKSITKGYLSQLTKEHSDFITHLNPASAVTMVKESDPLFLSTVESTYRSTYAENDLSGLLQAVLGAADTKTAMYTALRKAYLDGAIMAYLIDMISQSKVHDGIKTTNEVINKIKTNIANELAEVNKTESGIVDPEEERIRKQYLDEDDDIT